MNRELIHAGFENIASLNPNSIAIDAGKLTCNYFDLNRFSNNIAHFLLEKNIKIGDPIAVFMPGSIEYVSSLIGISKAGGVFLPIEEDYPLKRIDELFEQTRPKIVITDYSNNDKLFFLISDSKLTRFVENILVVNYREDSLLPFNVRNNYAPDLENKGYSNENPNIPVTGKDSSYLISTSGSTGTPKIIEGCHKGLSHFIHWQIKEFNIDSSVKVLQLAPITFDVSLRDIFLPLLSGGTLFISDKERKFNTAFLLDLICEKGINVLHIVPTIFRLLTEELKLNSDNADISPLKIIFLAGEPLYGKDINSWNSVMGRDISLINLYGPTETTLAKLFFKIPFAQYEDSKIIPLGKPIANTIAFVVNDDFQLCKYKEVGNIIIKTPFMSKGYFNNIALTKEKFIQNPLHNDFEDLVYITGDMGFLHEDNIHFCGRKDNQIKIRGNRVELMEIEAVLRKMRGIAQAVVIEEKKNQDQILICFYIKNGEIADINEDELRDFCKNYLPNYMIPAYFISLKSFPINRNGKIDRKGFIVPDQINQQDFEDPVSPTEKKLSIIWTEILYNKNIGRKDSFFKMGGTSLKAMRILSRVRKEFGVLIELPTLFSNPSIQQLGSFIDNNTSEKEVEISPAENKEFYDVSHTQNRLWILSHFEKEHKAYNIPKAYILTGKLNVNAVKEAFGFLIERHESLRTVFITVNGEPKQKINPNIPFNLEFEDITFSSNKDQIIEETASYQSNTTFDLAKGPLFRVKLLQIEAEKFTLFVTIHHIIADAWSLEVLYKEFSILYNCLNKSIENPLKPLRIHYKDYTYWQNEKLNSLSIEPHKEYWKGLKDNISIVNFPTDFPRPPIRSFNGGSIGLNIEEEVGKAIERLGEKYESTLFITLLTAVNILLYRYTSEENITVGTTVSGRDHMELENQIGFFVNTLVLRNNVNPEDSFESLLNKVKENTLEAFNHQIYPFDKLVKDISVGRDLSRSPLFDILVELINYEEDQEGNEEVEGIIIEPLFVEENTSKFDLAFKFIKSNGIHLSIEFNTDIFKPSTISRLLENFKILLNSIINNITTKVSDLHILNHKEKKDILKFSENNSKTVIRKTIIELFEEQVKLSPDNIALEFKECKLTYKELNLHSNNLANHLITNFNIHSNKSIGIMLRRSERMIIGLLGILKAGAAFVPIESDIPIERLKYIVSDCNLDLILTDADVSSKLNGFYNGSSILLDKYLNYLDPLIENPSLRTNIKNTAYIIYTSGSTGMPKGVEIKVESIVNYILWANSYYFQNSQNYVFSLFTSLAFDLTLTSIFTTLIRGDKLIIHEEKDVNTILLEVFNDSSPINVVKLTPSHISLLSLSQIKKTNIEVAILGGEMLTNEQVAFLKKINPEIKIFNEYGPTEATIGCTIKLIEDECISIGSPINNTCIYLLDPFLNLLPIGVLGEIYIGGIGLAKGYINKEDLTSQKFIPNPFKELDGSSVLYKSGDIGRWSENEEIEFYGRKDNQIKLSGYRIELNEIEHAILKFPQVQQAVALVAGKNTKSIIVYFTAIVEIDAALLNNHLQSVLPSYMRPTYLIQLEKIPITENGKVNVNELLTIEDFKQEKDVAYAPPSNHVEERLVKILEDILERKNIGINDDFFLSGGDSIKLTKFWYEINKVFPGQIEFTDLFRLNTIRGISSKILISDNLALNVSNNFVRSAFITDSIVEESKRNLFMLPPFSGLGFAYNSLAKKVRSHVNSFLFFYPAIFKEGLYFSSKEKLFQFYKDQILMHSDEKNIFLLGYSSGGHLVFEIGKLLEKEGVNFKLYIIDTLPKRNCIKTNNNYNLMIESYINELKIYINEDINSNQFINRYRNAVLNFGSVWDTYTETLGVLNTECCLFAREIYLEEKSEWGNHFNGKFEKIILTEGDHDDILTSDSNLDAIANKIISDLNCHSHFFNNAIE